MSLIISVWYFHIGSCKGSGSIRIDIDESSSKNVCLKHLPVQACLKNDVTTMVNVYVDLVVFTRIAGTS